MIYLLFLYNIIRIFFLKLRYKTFKADLVQRISPSVEIQLLGEAKMSIGKNVCISRNSSIVATNSGSINIGNRFFMNLRGINWLFYFYTILIFFYL